jgi:hypothetical protein
LHSHLGQRSGDLRGGPENQQTGQPVK